MSRTKCSMAELRAVCRKGGASSREDPFLLARYLYRPVSIYVTWLSIRLGLTANGVTLLSGVALFAAALLYATPSPTMWVIGGALVLTYVILDHVDGELARYERERLNRHSGMAGLFYDSVCHPGEVAVAVAIALRLYLDLGAPWWLPLIAVAMLFPGATSPWQRYCEALVTFAGRKVENDEARLPAGFLRVESITADASRARQSPVRTLLWLGAQLAGWSGQQLLLPICTILDVANVPALHIGEQPLPYLLLWLILRSVTAALAAMRSVLNYGRRLRSLG